MNNDQPLGLGCGIPLCGIKGKPYLNPRVYPQLFIQHGTNNWNIINSPIGQRLSFRIHIYYYESFILHYRTS